MQKLSANWITEHTTDFEYKKYVLLAYLQNVDKDYELNKLYPTLSELYDHYKTAKSFIESKTSFDQQVPHNISGINSDYSIQYEKVIRDDELMKQIKAIVDFSLPQFKLYIDEGKKIYDFIENKIHITPVGLTPLNLDFGYVLLRETVAATMVYEYSVKLFEEPDGKYRAVNFTFLTTYPKSIVYNSYENIKSDLLKKQRHLPNPATFAIESELTIPVNETFLPIAKRMLIKELLKI